MADRLTVATPKSLEGGRVSIVTDFDHASPDLGPFPIVCAVEKKERRMARLLHACEPFARRRSVEPDDAFDVLVPDWRHLGRTVCIECAHRCKQRLREKLLELWTNRERHAHCSGSS